MAQEHEADEPGEHSDQQQRKDQQQVQINVPARRHGDFVYQVKRQRRRRQPRGPAVAPLAKPLGSGRQRRQRRESIETAVENKVEVRRLHVDQHGAGLGLLNARSELGRKPARPISAARVRDLM